MVGSFRKVSEDSDETIVEKMKHTTGRGDDKAAQEENFDCRGVRDALSAIRRLSNLEGLVLLCDAVRFSTYQ